VFFGVFEGGLFENYQPKGLLNGILRVFCHNPRTEKSHPRKRHPFIYIYIQWVKNWGSGFWDSEWFCIEFGFLFDLFDLFDTFCMGFVLKRVFFWKAVLQVGSARSQLFMPGFRHAHTLQLLKSVFGHSPPGECLENNATEIHINSHILHLIHRSELDL